jgi:hypothetical protein
MNNMDKGYWFMRLELAIKHWKNHEDPFDKKLIMHEIQHCIAMINAIEVNENIKTVEL